MITNFIFFILYVHYLPDNGQLEYGKITLCIPFDIRKYASLFLIGFGLGIQLDCREVSRLSNCSIRLWSSLTIPLFFTYNI